MAQFWPYFCRFQPNLENVGYLFKRFFDSRRKMCIYNLNYGRVDKIHIWFRTMPVEVIEGPPTTLNLKYKAESMQETVLDP